MNANVPLPVELQACPYPVLESYVNERIKHFCRAFCTRVLPSCSAALFEEAFIQTSQVLGTQAPQYSCIALKFAHDCKFLGCRNNECALCRNNPNKTCKDGDHLCEAFADNQVLKAKCSEEVSVVAIDVVTNTKAASCPSGAEVVLSVIDGESYSEAEPSNLKTVRELLASDEGQVLINTQAQSCRPAEDGRLYLRLQDGRVRLPDVCITGKNDTFHCMGTACSSFRLMARLVQRDARGHIVECPNVQPAVSGKFVVKTQRALNDYSKSEYPHYRDELTKLRNIGTITAQRLKDLHQHLDCPLGTVETVEQLKLLLQYAEQDRQVESKLLELLNMKGKHKHKWDYLREVLAERVVYDDMLPRVWFYDEVHGVLFACKQAQVNLDRPTGLVQRVLIGGQSRLVAAPAASLDALQLERLSAWRLQAERSWARPGHLGWMVVTEPMDPQGGGPLQSNTHLRLPSGGSSVSDLQLEDMPGLPRPTSSGVSPRQSNRSRRSSVSHTEMPPPSSAPITFMPQQPVYDNHLPASQAGLPAFSLGSTVPVGNSACGQSARTSYARSSYEGDFYCTPASHSPLSSSRRPSGVTGELPPPMDANSGLFPDMCFAQGMMTAVGGGMATNLAGQNSLSFHNMESSAGRHSIFMAALGSCSGSNAPPFAACKEEASYADLGKRARAPNPNTLASMETAPSPVGQGDSQQPSQPASRHMLYHFESRGRHTPRSRYLLEEADVPAAMGASLEASDLDFVLAPTTQHAGSVVSEPPTLLPNMLMGMPTFRLSLGTDRLTGQMQEALVLNEPQTGMQSLGMAMGMGMGMSMGMGMNMGMGMGLGLNLEAAQGQSLAHEQHTSSHLMPQQLGGAHDHEDHSGSLLPSQGNRVLRRCESDSFKRFLRGGIQFNAEECVD